MKFSFALLSLVVAAAGWENAEAHDSTELARPDLRRLQMSGPPPPVVVVGGRGGPGSICSAACRAGPVEAEASNCVCPWTTYGTCLDGSAKKYERCNSYVMNAQGITASPVGADFGTCFRSAWRLSGASVGFQLKHMPDGSFQCHVLFEEGKAAAVCPPLAQVQGPPGSIVWVQMDNLSFNGERFRVDSRRKYFGPVLWPQALQQYRCSNRRPEKQIHDGDIGSNDS